MMNNVPTIAPLSPGPVANSVPTMAPLSPGPVMNNVPTIAPPSPGLRATPPGVLLSPTTTRSSFVSLNSMNTGMLSPARSRSSSIWGRRASTPFRSPSPSLMTSPLMWQKTCISRLAEEFFWIGGSMVAQPKWRLGQFVERCMCTMQTGAQMTKLKGKRRGMVRFFYLDEHRSCIRWKPSRKRDKAKITIDSMCEVCEGKKSEIFHGYADSRFDPNCCFSIYHGDRMESLNLVSTSAEEARTWITGLKYLMAGISDEDSLAKRQRTRDQWLQQTFSEADKNRDGTLSIGEVLQLLHKLNVNLPRQKVREMFKDADTDANQGSLGFEEFCAFYKMMSTRRDLYLIMISYSNQKEFLDLADLARFLVNEQKMVRTTREHCLEIVLQFEPCTQNLQNMVMGIDGFTNYMRSPAGDIFNPDHNYVHQDMNQPLNNYFIASSHNTYLTGDQFLSQSRVDMYAYVLQAGCRCIEVDCWDGQDGEPIIHHGYTLTSKILFRDVIDTINKYAFTKTQYPVILSIENHCTVPQQKKMAQYLSEVLQDKLDLTFINMNETTRKLPTPESLKGKVLVKGKKLPVTLPADAEEGDVSDEESDEEDDSEEDDSPAEADADGTPAEPKKKKTFRKSVMRNFRRKRKKKVKVKMRLMPNGEYEECHDNEQTQIVYHKKRKKTMRLSRALSDLVKYTKAVRIHDIETQALNTSWQVSSLNEGVVNQIMQLKPAHLVRLCQRQLLRVYPSNYRVDSSNYNPQPFWNMGIHMVALNYQTEGRMLELNRAMFATNGNCGYILKPKCMCKGGFNPVLDDPLQGRRKTQLVLKVISGQQLPKPKDSMLGDRGEIIDPFVEVEIIGLPIDCSTERTRVVDDNGFNPMWEETLVFTVHMPQITLVRFQVWDHDPIGRDFIGQRTIAFTSMMPGYRHIYLEGMEEASIFVHVAVNDISVKVKSSNAVKGLIKKAAKHTKGQLGHMGHSSQDNSSIASDDRLPPFRTDLGSFSEERESRKNSLCPKDLGHVTKDSLYRGALSEPVRRANRVQIQDSVEEERTSTPHSEWSHPDPENSQSESCLSQPDSPQPADHAPLSHSGCPEQEPPYQTAMLLHCPHQDIPGTDLPHQDIPGTDLPHQDIPTSDQNIPNLDQDIPTLDQDIPTLDQDIPSSDQDIPTSDQDIPTSDENIPSSDQDIPTSDQNIPTLDQDILTSDENIPSSDQDIPTSDQDIPTSDQNIPSSDQDIPTSDENIPSSDQDIPTSDQNISTSDQNIPSSDQDIPRSDQDIPSTDQDFPKSDQDIPTSDQDIPKSDQSIPTSNQAIPKSDPTHQDIPGSARPLLIHRPLQDSPASKRPLLLHRPHQDIPSSERPQQDIPSGETPFDWPEPPQVVTLREGREDQKLWGPGGTGTLSTELEAGTEPQSQSQTQLQPESEAKAQPQAQSQLQPQAQPQAQPEVQPQVPPQTQPETQAQPQPEGQPQVQPHVQPQPEAQLQTQLQTQSQTQPQAQPQCKPRPEPLPCLVAPPSPFRVRRTLQTPPIPEPSSPIWSSRSCSSRSQPNSPQTPAANRRQAVHWQTPSTPPPPPPPSDHGSYGNQVKPISNGLGLSDSESSSSESLEFPFGRDVPAGAERREGTLQREMKALFDEKMREIRCTSPMLFDDLSNP